MKIEDKILNQNYRHSASRGNDFIDSPGLWLMRNYFKVESDLNYSMIMGTASEIAVHAGLTIPGADTRALAEAQFKTMGAELLKKDQGEVPKQLDKVADIAENFYDILSNLNEGPILEYNLKRIIGHKSLNHQISIVPDFEYENLIVDTKATQQFPSDPFKTKQNHIRQAALYGILLNKPTALLYATDKKCAIFQLPPNVVKNEGEYMLDVFRKIEKTNKLFKNAKEFMEYTVLNTDGYKWDENTKTRANRYWSKT